MTMIFLAYARRQKDVSERGTAVVELAVAIPLLFIIAVVTLDISLGILAKTQLQNAARAAGEYATTNGWDQDGIANAADLAVQKSVFPITTTSVTSSVACYCTVGGTLALKSDTAPLCSVSTDCAAAGFVKPLAFATIRVTGSYQPLFPFLWTALGAGGKSLQFTVIARTSLPDS